MTFKNFIGKHNDTPDSEFDSEQLAMGIKSELEHTNNKTIAKSIAKDHLSEDPKYYTHLLAMEKKYVKESTKPKEEHTEEDPTFRIGAIVKVIKPYDGNSRIVGKIGVIRERYRNEWGVCFDENVGGHTLNNTCTLSNGWYIIEECLELIG